MKKTGILLCLSLLFASLASARPFFSDRFFEMRVGTDFSATNNAFTLNDILVRELEIDLQKIAGAMPDEGFVLTYKVAPVFAFNLTLPIVSAGVELGVEATGKEVVNKEFFDFLGYGIKVDENMEMKLDTYFDSYIYASVKYGMKLGRNQIKVVPSIFIPVASYAGRTVDFSYLNESDGNIILKMNSDINIHAAFDYNHISTDVGEYFNNAGFDLAGQYSFPINYYSTLTFKGRVPIVPGKLPYNMYEKVAYSYEKNLSDLVNDGNVSTVTKDVSDVKIDDIVVTNEEYSINRPLKFMALYNYAPRHSIFNFTAGAGIGVYHPFVENTVLYPEYTVDAQMNLSGLIKLDLSTEYIEQVFKHGFGLALNLRIFELDLGVSLQSASFVKSFSGAGYGGYVYYSMGF